MAAAGVCDPAGRDRNLVCAVCIFSDAHGGPVHRVFEVPALCPTEARESPDGAAAAALCGPVWLERDGASRGGRLPPIAAGGPEGLRDFWPELRAGRGD